jgi:hypothetical protein
MTAGVFASPDAPPIGLMEGMARVFETLERMSDGDRLTLFGFLCDPENPENELVQRRMMAEERRRARRHLTSVR